MKARRGIFAQGRVTAVTAGRVDMGETANVNMVRRAKQFKEALLEPGDTRQQWKGEAAACFVSAGTPVAVRYRPPVPATGPRHYLVDRFFCTTSASGATGSSGGDFLCVPNQPDVSIAVAKPAVGGMPVYIASVTRQRAAN